MYLDLHKTKRLWSEFAVRRFISASKAERWWRSAESHTHLVSVDGSEVFIHLINGVPLCRQRKKKKCSQVRHSFTRAPSSFNINMYQSSRERLYFPYDRPSAYALEITRILALTKKKPKKQIWFFILQCGVKRLPSFFSFSCLLNWD